MNIAYIKMDQPQKGWINLIKYKLKKWFVKAFKAKDENYYILDKEKKTIDKLIRMLRKDKVDYIIPEKEIPINYPQLDGQYLIKYMLPELVDYIMRQINPMSQEINICTQIYSNENISIIKELVNKVKTVNIISNNKNYTKLENELEKEGIYITVNNNPRKSLKRAILVINMDFKNIANYNYNRTMTIIDLTGNLKLPKGFEGIYIKSVKVRNR